MLNDFKKSFKLEYEKNKVFVPFDITLKDVNIFFEQLYKEVVDKAVDSLKISLDTGYYLSYAKNYEALKQVHTYIIGYLFNANTDLVYGNTDDSVLHAMGQDQAIAFIETIIQTTTTINGLPEWYNIEMAEHCIIISNYLFEWEGMFG